jgi:DNA-binding CsgD family transcriptional regulator
MCGSMASRPVPGYDPARLLGHVLSMLEDVPVGLLLLDADLRPLWYNAEAAQDCAVWNLGEKRASVLRSAKIFQLPVQIEGACQAIGAKFLGKESPLLSQVVSDNSQGLHAHIKLHVPSIEGEPFAYYIQLDYRRPRGDRHRQLSPGAVALLARFTPSEREVAIRVREGLSTREIASELGRSPHTIKAQLSSIFAKMGIRSRSRVAALLNR